MAQCKCYSIQNDTSNTLSYTYTDCGTNEIFVVDIDANTLVYTCSSNGVTSSAIVSIMANDSYCGGCTCGCETFIGFYYKAGPGVSDINYTDCNNNPRKFRVSVGPQTGPPGGQTLYLFNDNDILEPCVKQGTSITRTLISGSLSAFQPLFNGCCSLTYICYNWTVTEGEILPILEVSYTNTYGVYIEQVEVLTNIPHTENSNGTFTYFVCSNTPLEFYESGLLVVPPFEVIQGDVCSSDSECAQLEPTPCPGNLVTNPTFTTDLSGWTSLPFPGDWIWSINLGGSARYGGADEGGYLSQNILTVGYNYNISFNIFFTPSTSPCLNMSVYAGETQYIITPTVGLSTISLTLTCTVNSTFTIYTQTNCEDGIYVDNICVTEIPPLPSHTPTPTQTPTPTITPSATRPIPNFTYFQDCCLTSQGFTSYFGMINYIGNPLLIDEVYSVTVNNKIFCGKVIEGPIPPESIIYDYSIVELLYYSDCNSCLQTNPCPIITTPTPLPYTPPRSINECDVITIFPMMIECVVRNPSSPTAYDGMVSVSITGGTPNYKYIWGGIAAGNNGPAVEFLSTGTTEVTVVDGWGDFTATTTCVLVAEKDCIFSGTVVEFTPPTPTPTVTMTPTPSSIPSRCDYRYGNVYISQSDLTLGGGIVYVSFVDHNNYCYCIAGGEIIGGGLPYTTSGWSYNDICINVTDLGLGGATGTSLYILVGEIPQLIPSNGDSYVTLGGCCDSSPHPPAPSKDYSCNANGVCSFVGIGQGQYYTSNCDNQCTIPAYQSCAFTWNDNTKCNTDICELAGSTPLTGYTIGSVITWTNGVRVYINSSLNQEITNGKYIKYQGRIWIYGPSGITCVCIVGELCSSGC
jgi:hypothetical protein